MKTLKYILSAVFTLMIAYALYLIEFEEEKHGGYYVIEGIEIPAQIPDRPEIIIEYTGFTVSYNPDWKIPNWVAYELLDEEVGGETPRYNRFVPDPDLPKHQTAVDNDYRNSGYDRGHMAPAGDMKWNEQAMRESFYFTNICPQNHNLNAGDWKSLEEQVRALALEKGRIYVVCGPIVSDTSSTIGDNKVVVPDAFYKTLLQNDNGTWHSIGFIYKNKSGKKPMATYALSVTEVQSITGIDFFPALPDSIAYHVESEVDFMKWNVKSGTGY